MKKVKKTYSTAVLFAMVAGAVLVWYINRPDRFVHSNDQPLIEVTADNIGDYFKPNMAATNLKPEQWVEIEGRIKEVNTLNSRHTILLMGTFDESPYIICDMQTGQENELGSLKENDTIKVKGVFKGFLKDAVFLNCVITHQNSHE